MKTITAIFSDPVAKQLADLRDLYGYGSDLDALVGAIEIAHTQATVMQVALKQRSAIGISYDTGRGKVPVLIPGSSKELTVMRLPNGTGLKFHSFGKGL